MTYLWDRRLGIGEFKKNLPLIFLQSKKIAEIVNLYIKLSGGLSILKEEEIDRGKK